MRQTERLLFTKPAEDDLQRFYEINADPETNLFNPHGPMTQEYAQEAFDEMLKHWAKNNFGAWAIMKKANPSMVIGFGGLSYRLYEEELKLNLGYRLDKSYWGRGYATELAKNAIQFGFDGLHKKEIFALVRPQNQASINVLKKSGMHLFGTLADIPNEVESLIYKIINKTL